MDETLKTLRARIQDMLKREGWSPPQLTTRAGLSSEAIRSIIRDDRPSMPGAAVVARIAKATGRTTDWLLGLSNVEMARADALTETQTPYDHLRKAKQRAKAHLHQVLADIEENWPDEP